MRVFAKAQHDNGALGGSSRAMHSFFRCVSGQAPSSLPPAVYNWPRFWPAMTAISLIWTAGQVMVLTSIVLPAMLATRTTDLIRGMFYVSHSPRS
jgi:hypothetical protein